MAGDRGSVPRRQRPRRLRPVLFGAAVLFVAVFWLVGQAFTLRWQVHHLVTHTPEVVEDGSPTRSSGSQG